jgi:hypothetical protein
LVVWLGCPARALTVFVKLTTSNSSDVKKKSYGWVFSGVLLLTAVLTVADVGLIAYGYYLFLGTIALALLDLSPFTR